MRRNPAIQFRIAALPLVFLLTFLLTSFCPAYFTVYEREIVMPGWRPEHASLRFLVISDLHLWSGVIGSPKYAAMIREANRLTPDFIFLLGDTFSFEQTGKIYELNVPFVELFSKMEAKYGIFAVMGNHEFFSGLGAARAVLENAGITVLEDRLAAPVVNGTPLPIYGLRERSRREKNTPPEILEILRDLPSPLILSHRPDPFPELPADRPCLMLSGHTHGGLFRLPFLESGIFNFYKGGVCKQYTYGLFREGEKQLLVTSGMGDSSYYTRLNVPFEMVLLTIRPEEPSDKGSSAGNNRK